jgi:hypothetical protein
MKLESNSATASSDDLDDVLAEADAFLDARGVTRRTLAPTRDRATSLEALAARLFARRAPPCTGLAQSLSRALCGVVDVIVANFPENIFWDVDYLAASLWRDAVCAGDRAEARLDESAALVIELNELFGCNTDIRFRYIHDFIYGYDWAKWVQRDPGTRAEIGPFHPTFLRALLHRAAEIRTLIAQGDATYGRLAGDAPRNPFGFSREPADEECLHRALAAARLLPIEAWDIDAIPAWDRPFLVLREECARGLGLSFPR